MKLRTLALGLALCLLLPAGAAGQDPTGAIEGTVTDSTTSAITGARRSPVTGREGLQFRAEIFNVANHANSGLPVADLTPPPSAGASRPRLPG